MVVYCAGYGDVPNDSLKHGREILLNIEMKFYDGFVIVYIHC